MAIRVSRERLAQAGVGHATLRGHAPTVHISHRGSVTISGGNSNAVADLYGETKVVDAFDV